MAPESQKRLALSTHHGVLLQTKLPFGISSAPGYFQEIMEEITKDLEGVVVYLDDILVSGSNEEEHIKNLKSLLQRLQDKGLRCCRRKCIFAQSTVEYLGYTISKEGIAKGKKVDAILNMPPPTNIAILRSFLGSIQFYGKFIIHLSTLTDPLYHLLKKGVVWRWEGREQQAFEQLKDLLSMDTVLAHLTHKNRLESLVMPQMLASGQYTLP